MSKREIAKLDKLYQETILANNPVSILGGIAEVVHHFKPKSQGLAFRWWIPDGVQLTNDQHGDIHGPRKSELEGLILTIKGDDWRRKLINRQSKIARNLKFENVKNHILGLAEDYI